MSEERNPLYDNYKAMLIFLVVLGHIMEFYSIKGIPEVLRALIYSFHMPAFIFLSGFFSKNFDKNFDTLLVRCILPYLIFNTMWGIVADGLKIWEINIFFPRFVFWYLLSLFFWRVFTPIVIKIKFYLPVMIVLALYAGCLALLFCFALTAFFNIKNIFR